MVTPARVASSARISSEETKSILCTQFFKPKLKCAQSQSALPFPSQIHDRPLSQPEAKQDNSNNISEENMVAWPSGRAGDGPYLRVVLPEHPEEVQQCVGQRTLSGNVLSGARHPLETNIHRCFTMLALADAANRKRADVDLPWWNCRWCSLSHFLTRWSWALLCCGRLKGKVSSA